MLVTLDLNIKYEIIILNIGGDFINMKKKDILEMYFDSKEPLHLFAIPKKNSRKIEVLEIISKIFDNDVSYTEKEVNNLLKPIYDDYVLLRRYLVDYSFLIRTDTGSVYRKKEKFTESQIYDRKKQIKKIIKELFQHKDDYSKRDLMFRLDTLCSNAIEYFDFFISQKIIINRQNTYVLNYEKFQFSIFNYKIELNDEYSLVKNSRTGNIIKCKNSILNIETMKFLDKNYFFHLYDLDFIVPKLYDEIDMYMKNAMNQLNESKVMNVMLATTLSCNFKCLYCYENEISRTSEIKEEEVSNNFKKIKNYIKEKKIEKIIFTLYGGEPTLTNIRILEKISDEMNNLGVSFITDIITNGYNLSDEVITILNKVNLCNFQVTLDGPQKIHDNLRMLKNGGCTFDVIIRNISKIIEYKIAKKIIIRVNCSKYNIDYIDELLQYLSEKFHNNMSVFILSLGLLSYGLSEKTNNLIDNISINEEIEKYCTLYSKAKKLGFTIAEKYCISNLCINKSPKSIMIAPDNKYYKCMKAVGHENLSCSFESIDKSNLDLKYFDYCKNRNCPYVPYCYLGCLTDDYMDTGNMKLNCKYEQLKVINERLLYELYK